jgi:hypothetical protein
MVFHINIGNLGLLGLPQEILKHFKGVVQVVEVGKYAVTLAVTLGLPLGLLQHKL